MENRVKIELNGMEFHAYHGCLEQEKIHGNSFVVDFVGECEGLRAQFTDCLEDTVDYSAIYAVVAQEMANPSNLLEHVAGRIVSRIRNEFPEFLSFSVKVTKMHPPVGGPASSASVTITSE